MKCAIDTGKGRNQPVLVLKQMSLLTHWQLSEICSSLINVQIWIWNLEFAVLGDIWSPNPSALV